MAKAFLLFLIAPTFFALSAFGANLYVAPNGSDSNTGTSTSTPLKSILKASQLANPGDVIQVAPGTYQGGFTTTKSGTAAARIRYVSTVKRGAKLIPGSATHLWDNRGNYNDIIGFELDGSGSSTLTEGLYIGGSYNLIQGNHVHHIATQAVCNSNGGSAIGTDHYYYGVKNDVIGNEVHHIGTPTCGYIQGIYISTSGDVKNNIVYRVGAAAIHLWHDASDVNIINNTVVSSGTGIIVGGGDFYHSTNGMADNCNVFNNIVFDNDYGISEQGKTGPNNKFISNLVYRNHIKDWDLDTGKSHVGSIALDPRLTDYSATSDTVNLKLTSDSPAIDKGTSSLIPSTDFEGSARWQGAFPDIGAYERAVAVTPTPTPAPIKLSLSATSLSPGQAFTVTVSGTTASANANDYVALYLASATDAQWSYDGQTSDVSGTLTFSFKAPANPGVYNIRLFGASNAQNRLAVSANITVSKPPAPVIALSSSSLSFGWIKVGSSSAIKYVTIKNTGNAALSFTSSALSGDFVYGQVGTCYKSLAAGSSCTYSLKFSPKATGSRTGSLVINTNAPVNGVIKIGLSGSGY